MFWEDDKAEFAEQISELEIDGIEVVIVNKNELATKRLVLFDESETRFLVYCAGGAGDVAEDFRLDVKLAAESFSCSQAAVWAQDCGLASVAAGTVDVYAALFEAAGWRGEIAAYTGGVDSLDNQGDEAALDLAMVAVCCEVKLAW